MKTILTGLVVVCLLTVLCAAADEKAKPLTNEDVLKMLEAKLPESVILTKIRTSKVKFDSSTDAIIALHKKGVSEKVLNAIISPTDGGADAKPAERQPAEGSNSVTPPIAPPGERPDTLSYGTATGLVKKGLTTQAEILNLFGGPNVTTTDRDGTEIWMYDKTTSTTTTSGKQTTAATRKSEAEVMAGYLGIPLFAGIAGAKAKGKEDTKTESESAGTVTHSVKTITFIIKFNADKTVKDYAVRQATF